MSVIAKRTQSVATINDLHVIVLVAGTSDPVNTFVSTKKYAQSIKRANSYPSVSLYWDDTFFTQILKLQSSTEEYKPMIVFDKHGWSGDNSVNNREIAGAYLVNRLCGAEGLEAYYKAWKDLPVTFHLLGHSHGGNVINEMTKQMDKLGDAWPKHWKVKSLTYLSTPFFNELHQVKVTEKTFHQDAEVLHLYNKYDLTQRMLADFSMEPLAKVLIGLDTTPLEEALIAIQEFKWPEIQVHLEDTDERWYVVDMEFVIPHETGNKLYASLITMLQNLQKVFDEIYNLVKVLADETEFQVSREILKDLGEDILQYKRVIVPSDIKEEFEKVTKQITTEIQKNITKLEKTNIKYKRSGKNYLVNDLIDDFVINDLVQYLLNFLDIEPQTLKPRTNTNLWHLTYLILKHNIDVYDDTYADPTFQFKSTSLSGKIQGKNITDRDAYDGTDGSANFDAFISYIEKVEKNYKSDPSEKNLLDLLFVLIQQLGVIYNYKGVGFGTGLKAFAYFWKGHRLSRLNFKASNFEKRLFQLADVVKNYEIIFKARDFGGVVDSTHKVSQADKKKGIMQRGSILYLLMESHSTSRRVLHDEVRDFLRRLGPQK
ncbi:MAG: hypothetical protein ACU88J_12550 [Gammaproteobacteria bacterium]